MPFYSYLCAECGPFDEIGSLSDYEEPRPCPECGASSPRGLGAPMIRSASGEPGKPALRSPRHAVGCGCCAPGLRGTSSARAAAAGAPRRGGAAAPAGSFLTRA